MDSANNVFRLLSGGAFFDRKKNSKEKNLFEKGAQVEEEEDKSTLPSLDFFKRTTVTQPNGNANQNGSKKRKNVEVNSDQGKKVSTKTQASETNEDESDISSNKKLKQDDTVANVGQTDAKKKKKNKKKKKETPQAIQVDDGISLFKTSRNNRSLAKVVESEDQPTEQTDDLQKVKSDHIEKINNLRNRFRIKVVGDAAPDPIEHFDDLEKHYNIRPYLIKNIKDIGYSDPTPIQMQALPSMLHGREVLSVAPTGSGKTAAFLIPILAHLREPKKEGYRAVIVSPTRELALQIHRECVKLGEGKQWRTCVLTNVKQAAATHKYDILVTTPMRLVHLVKEESVKLDHVEWLVFDEADRLFDEGFIVQVDEIIAACTNSERKVCLFSATMPPVVEEMAKSVQKDPISIVIGARNVAAATVNQKLLFVGSEEGKLLAIRQLIRGGKMTPPALIFVQSKERAQQLFHELVYDGINVDVIHADRTQSQRNSTVDKFRSGDIWVLVTTDLFSRGMDIKGVNLVINYDFPQSTVSYIHRIGRTGRAGRNGEAITFYTEEDFVQMRSIANVMKESGCNDIPEWVFTTLNKPRKDTKKKLEKRPVQRKDIYAQPFKKGQQNKNKGNKGNKGNNQKKEKKSIDEKGGQVNDVDDFVNEIDE